MSVDVSIEQCGNYLHATITGPNSAESVLSYMGRIQEACNETQCFRVLIDEQLEGPRFDEMQIFALIQDGSSDALGFFEAVAYVDEKQDFERTKFAETVAVNRGIPVAVFTSVDDAGRWLANGDEEPTGKDIFKVIDDA